jgi:hypothetical protein
MAARPIPITDDPPVITIDANGNVSSPVTIPNNGQVTFQVTGYKSGNDECRITISANNIGWHKKDVMDEGTIKIGAGGEA